MVAEARRPRRTLLLIVRGQRTKRKTDRRSMTSGWIEESSTSSLRKRPPPPPISRDRGRRKMFSLASPAHVVRIEESRRLLVDRQYMRTMNSRLESSLRTLAVTGTSHRSWPSSAQVCHSGAVRSCNHSLRNPQAIPTDTQDAARTQGTRYDTQHLSSISYYMTE